jgi:hypothetical protein
VLNVKKCMCWCLSVITLKNIFFSDFVHEVSNILRGQDPSPFSGRPLLTRNIVFYSFTHFIPYLSQISKTLAEGQSIGLK